MGEQRFCPNPSDCDFPEHQRLLVFNSAPLYRILPPTTLVQAGRACVPPSGFPPIPLTSEKDVQVRRVSDW